MRRIARVGGLVALVSVTMFGLAAPASANHVSCGDVITQNTTLDRNVGPCPDGGLVVDADNITVNLNGHRVFGTDSIGDGAGILIQQQTGVVVRDGAVTDFDGGVVIEGGTANTVRDIVAKDNIGQGADPHHGGEAIEGEFGDGILIEGSSNNRILDNRAINNGPFSGIGLIEVPDSDHSFPAAPTANNLVSGNFVSDNTSCRPPSGGSGEFCDNDGIRIEPSVGPGNIITRNTVQRSGLDGISLFGRTTENQVTDNTVSANGFLGAVPGDGIRVFGFNNLIQNNTSSKNANDGISVGRRSISPPGSFPVPNGRNNRILKNKALKNGSFDLYDSNRNPDCDANAWLDNKFDVAAPTCTQTQS